MQMQVAKIAIHQRVYWYFGFECITCRRTIAGRILVFILLVLIVVAGAKQQSAEQYKTNFGFYCFHDKCLCCKISTVLIEMIFLQATALYLFPDCNLCIMPSIIFVKSPDMGVCLEGNSLKNARCSSIKSSIGRNTH